jgi:NADH:ubiquinone oxidoreductase subunit H
MFNLSYGILYSYIFTTFTIIPFGIIMYKNNLHKNILLFLMITLIGTIINLLNLWANNCNPECVFLTGIHNSFTKCCLI